MQNEVYNIRFGTLMLKLRNNSGVQCSVFGIRLAILVVGLRNGPTAFTLGEVPFKRLFEAIEHSNA